MKKLGVQRPTAEAPEQVYMVGREAFLPGNRQPPSHLFPDRDPSQKRTR